MTEEIEKNIEEIARKIAEKFQPEKIILFGSYAWGQPHKDSDIDLLIVKTTDKPRQLSRDIDGHIFPRKFPIDLLVSSPDRIKQRLDLGDRFYQKIINTGKVLYEQ